MTVGPWSWLDLLVFVISILSPFQSVPQLYKIIKTESSVGVSSLQYWLQLVFNVFWFLYGLTHDSYPNIISGAGSVTVAAILLFYIQRYGASKFAVVL
jgi:uncharacterized protein with PQ loop repeat